MRKTDRNLGCKTEELSRSRYGTHSGIFYRKGVFPCKENRRDANYGKFVRRDRRLPPGSGAKWNRSSMGQ